MSYESEFREWVLPFIEDGKDDASRLVMDDLKHGDSLGDAVADTIESLPARKTMRLRKIVSLFECWRDWVELVGKGWEIDRHRKWQPGNRITVYAPNPTDRPWIERPADEIIAAGAGVLDVVYVKAPRADQFVYEVMKI